MIHPQQPTRFGQIKCTDCGEMVIWSFDDKKRMALQFDVQVPVYKLTTDGVGDPIATPQSSYFVVAHFYVCKARPQEPIYKPAKRIPKRIKTSMKMHQEGGGE